jgi:hypothetical protein
MSNGVIIPLMAKTTDSSQQKKSTQSSRKELLLFLLIPVAVISILAAILLIPGAFAKPQYDFIYSICPDYTCSYDFRVGTNEKLTRQLAVGNSTYYDRSPILYYHDTAKNASRPIDETSAQELTLDSSNVSADGYHLRQPGTDDGGFLLWSGPNDSNWYLVNGLKKKEVNLATTNGYGNDITFVGWVSK